MSLTQGWLHLSEGAPGLAQPPVGCLHLSEGAPRLAQPEEHEMQAEADAIEAGRATTLAPNHASQGG